MASPLRIEKAGGWYHVTARSNERKQIFRSDLDRRHFPDLLAEMVSRFRVRLRCFVLTKNHYHLLVDEVGGLGGSGRTRPEQTPHETSKTIVELPDVTLAPSLSRIVKL